MMTHEEFERTWSMARGATTIPSMGKRIRKFKCSHCKKTVTPPLSKHGGGCPKCGRVGTMFVLNKSARSTGRDLPSDYRPSRDSKVSVSCCGCGAVNREVERGGPFECWRCGKEQTISEADGYLRS